MLYLQKPRRPAYIVDLETNHWIWNGCKLPAGYGKKGANGYAHRWVYETLVGHIPEGMTIDHLCRVTSCVNPEHLEVVSMAENIRRGFGVAGINTRKTHCPKGHSYDMFEKDGSRGCRTCHNEKVRNAARNRTPEQREHYNEYMREWKARRALRTP
jgi:hypothetical protein